MSGEKISRLGVGLFALLLIGGLGAFFAGLLDPLLGTSHPPTKQPPAPLPFPKQATQPVPGKPAVPHNSVIVASPNPSVAQPAASVAPQPAKETSVPPHPVAIAKAEPVNSPKSAQTESGLPPPKAVANTQAVVPSKPSPAKPARSHDMDLRNCLDLTDNLAIAQCAYKAP